MAKILCATRGGEASYHTQDAAIALAQERGETLLFLYAVDLRFLDKRAGAALVDVESEMTKMGKFLLLMAQERAAEQGVPAETYCGKGELRPVLQEVVEAQEISLILLGSPAGEESVFQLAGLRDFAAEIEHEAGVETRVI